MRFRRFFRSSNRLIRNYRVQYRKYSTEKDPNKLFKQFGVPAIVGLSIGGVIEGFNAPYNDGSGFLLALIFGLWPISLPIMCVALSGSGIYFSCKLIGATLSERYKTGQMISRHSKKRIKINFEYSCCND